MLQGPQSIGNLQKVTCFNVLRFTRKMCQTQTRTLDGNDFREGQGLQRRIHSPSGLCRLTAALSSLRKLCGDSVRDEDDPDDDVRLLAAVSPPVGTVMPLPALAPAAWEGVGGRRKLSLLSIGGGGGGAHRHLAGEADPRR